MSEPENDDSPRYLKTVDLSLSVLLDVKRSGSVGVTEVANHLGISKGAAYNHIVTLRKHGFLAKRGAKYELGSRFVAFGESVKNRSKLYREGRPLIDELAAETGEYAHLMALQNARGIHVHHAKGDQAVGDDYYQHNQENSDPLYYSATGKAALAFMPAETVDSIVESMTMEPETSNTVTDKASFRDELQTIRDRGYSINDEEQFIGLRAIGTPIRGDDDRIIGSISVSGPVSRISDEKFRNEIPDLVREVGNVIEIRIRQSEAI